jgi:hypothetical protein
MHLLAYAYAIFSLVALLAVVIGEFRRQRRVYKTDKLVMPKDLSEASPAAMQGQAARAGLQAACRSSARYELAHYSLGRTQLEQRKDE